MNAVENTCQDAAIASVADRLALNDGDNVSLAGAMTPKAWNDKTGEAHCALDMMAHAVLTPYHVARKRQSVKADRGG